MIVSNELANETPVCACGEYIVEGENVAKIHGQVGQQPAWWVQCPNCGSTMGFAHIIPAKPTRKPR